MVKKILYVTSTLKKTGPINQLYNLIDHLDREEYEPHLITLSPEALDSRWTDYEALGVKLYSLNLSRVGGVLFARSRFKKIIEEVQPDLVHTHGLRADSLLASARLSVPWVMTSHNFPAEDYPAKFGGLKGALMVRQHLHAMKRCQYLVACSKSVHSKLEMIGVNSVAIQNGVSILDGHASSVPIYSDLARPIYISVGSLIPRKNAEFLIDAYNNLPGCIRGSLMIIGDGPLMSALKSKAVSDVHFVGNVNNVADYLAGADYFVSASLSEGLPNTVLEGLASGLGCILSDIESHQEIALESPLSCKIFKLDQGINALSRAMANASSYFDDKTGEESRRVAQETFSAERMSARYQSFYEDILEAK